MTKQPIIFTVVACATFLSCVSGVFATTSATPAPPEEAERLVHTPEGAAYGKAFAAAVAQKFVQARDEGIVKLKLQPPQQIDITFVVSAGGQITDTLAAAGQPLSAYIAKKLIGSKVPKPPHADYPVRVHMHAGAR